MNQTVKAFFVVGIGIFVTGLVLGVVPVSVAGYDCGAAFFPDDYNQYDCAVLTDLYSRRIWSFALMALGTVLFLGGAFLEPRESNT